MAEFHKQNIEQKKPDLKKNAPEDFVYIKFKIRQTNSQESAPWRMAERADGNTEVFNLWKPTKLSTFICVLLCMYIILQ